MHVFPGPGSGIYGSIVSSDLAGAAAGAPAASGAPLPQPAPGARYVDIPLSNMRAIIAKRLLQSKTSIPHYQLSCDINVDRISKLRADFNKKLEKDGVKLSVNDFIVKAVALACKKVPAANSAWMDTFIRQWVTLSPDLTMFKIFLLWNDRLIIGFNVTMSHVIFCDGRILY